jgi:UPF0755 protein
MSELSLSEVLPGAFPPQQSPNRRRGAARQQRKRRKRRRQRSFFVLFLTVLIVGGGVAGAYFGLSPVIRQLTAPKDYDGSGTGKVTVKIPSGASGHTIARILATSDVVKTEVAYLNAAAKNQRTTGIQPGTYAMKSKMSGAAAVADLLDPKSRLTLTVTIPEGTRAADIYRVIAKDLGVTASSVKKAANSGSIGLPAAAKGKPEGFLFPETYSFDPDTTATEALKSMVEQGQKTYTALGITDAQLREDVIKASIIQAEAGNQGYMGKISRVLDNRLAGHTKLQLDSTVSYATQKFNVTTTSADRASNSGYNTYRVYGLPAGPIDNPGKDALKAAISPTPGPWLFFVTVNPTTGETKFAATAAEHSKNVAEFQAWLRAHPNGK